MVWIHSCPCTFKSYRDCNKFFKPAKLSTLFLLNLKKILSHQQGMFCSPVTTSINYSHDCFLARSSITLLFQLTLLEHLQISFTLVAFTSVPSSSSPCTSWMCLQITSQVSLPTGITLSLTFQPAPSFQSSPQSSIPIFSPQMAIVLFES